MEIANDAYCQIKRYFDVLGKTGYYPEGDVGKFIIYLYIIYLLEGELSDFVTDEDYRTIYKALVCLWGSSCLIPYPEWRRTAMKRRKYYGSMGVRVSEEDESRSTEGSNGILRTVENPGLWFAQQKTTKRRSKK